MYYRTFDLTLTPLGKGKILVHSKRSGKTRVLTRPLAHLLLACDTFKSLHDHTAKNWLISKALDHTSGANTGASGHTHPMASVEQQLQSFIEDGFLVSNADLLAEIRDACASTPETVETSGKVTSLGIPTRDRPESLKRALASYIENTVQFDRTPSFTIVDDSRDSGTQQSNREALLTLQRRYGVHLRYVNRDISTRFARTLSRHAGIPEHVVSLSVLGDKRCDGTYGAVRNSLLLDSVGEISIQADDDTVCNITSAPVTEAGLALTSRMDANEYWFFESLEDALDTAVPVEKDLLHIHEQLVGGNISDCILPVLDAGEDLDVTGIEPPFLDGLAVSPSKVAASFIGTAGDSGAPYSFRFLREDHTFNRLTASEAVYRTGMTTRQMIKAATRPQISDGFFCMTSNIGLDFRTLLPPFMPVLRNEDGSFGSILNVCFPGLYTGYLPYSVHHLPPGERPPLQDLHVTRYRKLLANTLLVWIIMSFRTSVSGPDGKRNIRSLGRYLQDVGLMTKNDFAGTLRTIAFRTVGAEVAYAERQLEERRGAPDYWVKDVTAYLQASEEAVLQPDFAVPSDLEGRPEERLVLFQDLVFKFGELLEHWPDLVEAAKELRVKGRRISVPLDES